jgi:hypothetical protein
LEQKKGYIIVLILLVAVLGVRMFMNQGDTEQAAEATDHIKEIHIAMLKAEEAYSWFTGFGEINMDAREHYFDNGSVWYGIVEHEDISTMDELETYLSRLFDDTTCNMLLSTTIDDKGTPLFMMQDDVLYCAAGVVSQMHYKDCDWELDIKSIDSGIATVAINWNMLVWDLPLEGSYEMKCVSGPDGIWRFNNFVLPVEAAVSAYSNL